MKLSISILVSTTVVCVAAATAAATGQKQEQHLRQLPQDDNNNNNNNNNNNDDNAGGKTWSTTLRCDCYEYLTDDIFRSETYNFHDKDRDESHHYEEGKNEGYYDMAEFCCEFGAELVDPKCSKDGDDWINGDGQPPHAPVEALICDIFDEPDAKRKNELKIQARNACFCFYRDLGCGRDELTKGGYCDYPNSEVTLDDFRMANNSAHNMCNACLEQDNNYNFPDTYEGLPHGQCLGYCLLKRGDPNDVYSPTVENKQCCFETNDHGFGFDMNGFETNKIGKEIIYMPFESMENRVYDHFFNTRGNIPYFSPTKEYYDVTMSYNGLCTAFVTIERYGDGSTNYAPSQYSTSEFNINCEPEDWTSLSVHVYDEIAEGGIAFKDVTLDGVELGDFGFEVAMDPSCLSDKVIMADTAGIHGSNHSCITRPGGFGHMAGFELKGQVELSGYFRGDGIGLELIIGCKKKDEEKTCCCSDGDMASSIKGYASPW